MDVKAKPSLGYHNTSCYIDFCSARKKTAEKCGNTEMKIKALIQEGLIMMDQSRICDAEETLREGLALCLKSLGDNTLTTARCYEGDIFCIAIFLCMESV